MRMRYCVHSLMYGALTLYAWVVLIVLRYRLQLLDVSLASRVELHNRIWDCRYVQHKALSIQYAITAICDTWPIYFSLIAPGNMYSVCVMIVSMMHVAQYSLVHWPSAPHTIQTGCN